MNELTVEAGGVRVVIAAADDVDIWVVARGALEHVIRAPKEFSSSLYREEEENSEAASDKAEKRLSAADQIRAIAYTLLADGRVHERAEIARLARERGLDPRNVAYALKGHFEETKSESGRVCYRDPVADPDEPEWMRRWNEDQIAAVVAANGGKPSPTYLPDEDGRFHRPRHGGLSGLA
jgi:hypothetical protein